MIVKQPNGKLCLMSWDGSVEKMNMTEDEYVQYCIEKAREEAKNNLKDIKNFRELIEHQKVTDEQLKQMGSDRTLFELLKFVPRKPLQQQYISCNFETQGKCPSCQAWVANGIGGKIEKCKCGQILDWN